MSSTAGCPVWAPRLFGPGRLPAAGYLCACPVVSRESLTWARSVCRYTGVLVRAQARRQNVHDDCASPRYVFFSRCEKLEKCGGRDTIFAPRRDDLACATTRPPARPAITSGFGPGRTMSCGARSLRSLCSHRARNARCASSRPTRVRACMGLGGCGGGFRRAHICMGMLSVCLRTIYPEPLDSNSRCRYISTRNAPHRLT